MISLRKVSKTYDRGRVRAVREIDIEVDEGEFVILLGGSGCGKTTTLKMINRLIERSGGEILVGGRDVSTVDPVELRRGVGYVFQGIGLFLDLPRFRGQLSTSVFPLISIFDFSPHLL